MIKIVKRIINYFKLKKVRKELVNLDKKYFAIVNSNMKKTNSSSTVWFYPIGKNNYYDSSTVEFSKGLEFGLNPVLDKKELVLAYFDKTDIDLITKYVFLLGLDESIVKF